MKDNFYINSKVRVGLINHILDNCGFLNFTREDLIKNVGLNERELLDPNAFISFNYLEKIILFLYSNSNDSLIVLKFIEKNNSIANGVLGYLIEISSSLSEAIETFEKYWELNGRIGKVILSERDDDVLLEWSCLQGSPSFVRYATEYKIAWWVSIVNLLKNDGDPVLKEIHFKHKANKSDDIAFYENFFKCPVCFNQSESAIILSKDSLKLPFKTANRRLYENIENYAKVIIRESNCSHEFSNSVRSILYTQVHQKGNLSREYIAEKLGISVRTLSRKLFEENNKYTNILEEVRIELAKNYLENSQLKVSVISKSLGFYTSNAFITWFKSITGKAPQKYRDDYSKF